MTQAEIWRCRLLVKRFFETFIVQRFYLSYQNFNGGSFLKDCMKGNAPFSNADSLPITSDMEVSFAEHHSAISNLNTPEWPFSHFTCMTGIGNSSFDPQGFATAIAMLPTHITFSFLSAVIRVRLENMHCTCITKCLLIPFSVLNYGKYFLNAWSPVRKSKKNHMHFCPESMISLLLIYRHRIATVL